MAGTNALKRDWRLSQEEESAFGALDMILRAGASGQEDNSRSVSLALLRKDPPPATVTKNNNISDKSTSAGNDQTYSSNSDVNESNGDGFNVLSNSNNDALATNKYGIDYSGFLHKEFLAPSLADATTSNTTSNTSSSTSTPSPPLAHCFQSLLNPLCLAALTGSVATIDRLLQAIDTTKNNYATTPYTTKLTVHECLYSCAFSPLVSCSIFGGVEGLELFKNHMGERDFSIACCLNGNVCHMIDFVFYFLPSLNVSPK
jgi:hypothetical protein